MRRTCDRAPVQYEGAIDSKCFYFRARWDEWSFTVADSFKEAITGLSEGELFMRTGRYGDNQHPYAASYMPYEEAERLIRACADEYVAERNNMHG
jgi:hypothetical protein